MQALLLLLLFLLPPEAEAEAEKIIGGTECKPHSRPYMAHLKIINNRGLPDSCGGFLISQDFVLTAAHCQGRHITVTLGGHDMKQEESSWQQIDVAEQFIHPYYNAHTQLNDIMLLKLQRHAKLTDAVGTVPLPSWRTFIQTGRMCRTAGWGKTGLTEPMSNTLREVKLRVMDSESCHYFYFYSHKLQMCVGNPKAKRSAYKGDSGGPLLCAGVAQGIVSYATGDAQPPVVFTRLSSYVPWIHKVLKDN